MHENGEGVQGAQLVCTAQGLVRVGGMRAENAAGATSSYFGHNEWETIAPTLKTVEDAFAIRRRILSAFESAELETYQAQEIFG